MFRISFVLVSVKIRVSFLYIFGAICYLIDFIFVPLR